MDDQKLIKIDFSDLQPEGLMKVVKSQKNPLEDGGLNLGIEQTSDLARTYFAGSEAFNKSMGDGVLTGGDLMNLVTVGLTLPGLISGADMIKPEILDLSIAGELPQLVAIANEYELGVYKEKAINSFIALIYVLKTVM